VNFVIKRDNRDMFRFAPLQSDVAKEMLSKFKLDDSVQESVILVSGENIYSKSTAALKIAKELSGRVKVLYPLILLPKFFRDVIYEFVARNRYKIFGKRDSCRIPTEEEKLKFLD
jgi:predicted DCC family thiol-disulfide oxidoreductase YuxK